MKVKPIGKIGAIINPNDVLKDGAYRAFHWECFTKSEK